MSFWDGEMVALCLTVRMQSSVFAVGLSQAVTTRLGTDSDSGKQREHLSLLSVTGLDMRGDWSGVWSCVFYHLSTSSGGHCSSSATLGRSALSSPGPCISPDTSNIANCKHSLFVHPIPSHQTNTTSHPHHNPPHTTTYYLTALLLKFQLDRN